MRIGTRIVIPPMHYNIDPWPGTVIQCGDEGIVTVVCRVGDSEQVLVVRTMDLRIRHSESMN